MAIRKYISFHCQWQGNGTDSSVAVNFTNDPIQFSTVSSSSLTFNALASLPNVLSDIEVGGATLSSSSYSAVSGVLTVNFSDTPTNGSIGYVNGLALYN